MPVFVDKHLSYDHQQGGRNGRHGKKLGFPLMAGSSLPVTWRGAADRAAAGDAAHRGGRARSASTAARPRSTSSTPWKCCSACWSGGQGGETGVKSVDCLQGDAVWKAGDDGRISWPLVEEAVGRCQSANVGPIRENVTKPMAILVEYRDGTRGAVLNLIEADVRFRFRRHGSSGRKPSR